MRDGGINFGTVPAKKDEKKTTSKKEEPKKEAPKKEMPKTKMEEAVQAEPIAAGVSRCLHPSTYDIRLQDSRPNLPRLPKKSQQPRVSAANHPKS